MDESFKQRDEELTKIIESNTLDPEDQGFASSTGELLGMMYSVMSNIGNEGGAAGAGLAALTVATGLAPATGGLSLAIGGAMLGAGALSMYRIEGGLHYKDLREMGVDHETAMNAANFVGLINASIEVGGVKLLGEATRPLWQNYIRSKSSDLAKSLVKPGVFGLVKQTAGAMGKSVVAEVGTEIAQEATNIVSEQAVRAITGNENIEEATFDSVYERLKDIAIKTAQGVLVLGGLGATPAVVHGAYKIRKAKESKEFFDTMSANTQNMKARQIAPDVVHAVIAQQAAETGNETVFIDAVAFNQTMIDMGLTMQELAQVAPAIAQDLPQALSEGRDIEIATADFATKLAPTEFGQALNNHVRLSEDALSFNEAVEVEREMREYLQVVIKAADGDQAAIDQLATSEESGTTRRKKNRVTETQRTEIKARFVERLKEAGFDDMQANTQAEIGSRIVANLARNTGMAVEDLEGFVPKVIVQNVQNAQQDVGVVSQDNVNMRANAEATLEEEVQQWEAFVEGLESKPTQPVVMLKQTPLVMHLVGANFRELVATPHFFDRMFSKVDGESSTFGKAEIKQIPKALTSPIAIFDQDNGRKLFLLDLKTSSGASVVVPVEFEAGNKFATVNLVVTAFAKEKNGKPKLGWLKDFKGKLVYVNTKKIASLNTFAGANSLGVLSTRLPSDSTETSSETRQDSTSGTNSLLEPTAYDTSVLTEKDLVKLRLQYGNKYYSGNVRGSYNPAERTITLTPNADLSTFVHELSHWYLENLFTLSTRDGVSETVKEDVAALLKEFGLSSAEEFISMPMEQKRKLHERFASQAEIYFAEAKSPTPGLQRLMRRFADFMMEVYRGLTNHLVSHQYKRAFGEELPAISDEVRRVFDRMIACDNAIRNAEKSEGLVALFKERPEGMSEADWMEMALAQDEAHGAAFERLLKERSGNERWYTRAASEVLKNIQKQGEAVKEELRPKVEAEVNKRPEVLALCVLQDRGYSLGYSGTLMLSSSALRAEHVDQYVIQKLRKLGVVAPDDEVGMTPAQVLDALKPVAEFKSNRSLIKALLVAADKERIIDEEVVRQATKTRADLFNPKKQQETIIKALHEEARQRVVASELKYLTKSTRSSRVMIQAAKLSAQEIFGRTSLNKASPKHFMNLEARASRKALAALQAGDMNEAIRQKRMQLIYHEAVRLALETQYRLRRVNTIRKEAFKADKKIAKTRDIDTVNFLRLIMTNLGLGRVAPEQADVTLGDKFMNRIRREGSQAEIAFYESVAQSYRYRSEVLIDTMPMSEVREFLDVVISLWHRAREERSIVLNGKREERKAVVENLLNQIDQTGRREYDPTRDRAVTDGEKLQFKWLSLKNQLKRVESWCAAMDADNPDKPFQTYIFRPIANASQSFRVKNADLQKKLLDLIKPLQKTWAESGEIEAPEIGYTFANRQELIGALLHTGNASNKDKLISGGRGPNNPWGTRFVGPDGREIVSHAQWDQFFNRAVSSGIITKEDMDFVQAVWDLLEDTKPLAQKAFKDLYGYEFEEIEAQPISTPWGEYRGGYVPAVTDRYLVAERTTQEELARITEQDYLSMMPVNEPGFTKHRVAGYTKPLSLDLSMLCGHINKVLRFAYIAPVAQQVGKIIADREFVDAMNDMDPHLLSGMIKPWLKRAYEQTVSDGKEGWVSQQLNKLRSIAGMNIMAGHIVNALQQTTGLSIALTKVSGKSMTRAMAMLAQNPRQLIAETCELSSLIAARLIEQVAKTPSSVKKSKTKIDKILAIDAKLDPARAFATKYGYIFQSLMQAPIDVIVWQAAYNDAVEAGRSHADAVMEADSVVRTTQSDFSPENLAAIETGPALKRAFLVFYNYFGMQLNLLGERYALAKQTKKYGQFAKDALLIVWIPSVISAIMSRYLQGVDPGGDDEDDEVWIDSVQLLIGEPLKNIITMVPIVGSFVNTAGAEWAKSSAAGSSAAKLIWGRDPYAGRIMSSPAFDTIAGAGRGARDVLKVAAGEDVNARSATRNLLDLLSVTTGLPVGALKKPAGYTAGVLAGEIEPENATDYIRGIVSGKDLSK